jgi:hypothetical protein
MARILGVPLLWCGLHKFNLAIKNWVAGGTAQSLLRIVMNLSILLDGEGRNAKKLCHSKTIHSSCDHHRKCNMMVISAVYQDKMFL